MLYFMNASHIMPVNTVCSKSIVPL